MDLENILNFFIKIRNHFDSQLVIAAAQEKVNFKDNLSMKIRNHINAVLVITFA